MQNRLPILLVITSFSLLHIPKSFCQTRPCSDYNSCRRSLTPTTSPPSASVVANSPLPPLTPPPPAPAPAPAPTTGFPSQLPGSNPHGTVNTQLILGLSVGIAMLVIIIVLINYLGKRCSCWEAVMMNWSSDSDGGSNTLIEEYMKNYGSLAPKLYTFSEIRKMTSSFAEKLGQGGYGCVYKGSLADGREVAVKVLDSGKGNGEDFINEVSAISQTSHVNVVTLLGFCCSKKNSALIYEFMPNGSLDSFLAKKGMSTGFPFQWKLLYEITVGIARGLDYLHRGCNTRIVHFDIKPQNILLDADFCPKISDFGLARLCKKKQSFLSTVGARGTIGYIAPEVFSRNFGRVSHKSDVYSYGMMVLDLVGLTRKLEADSRQQVSENYFPDWIYEHVQLQKELPLQSVRNQVEKETAMKMTIVGLWCIQTNPCDRPSITKVVDMLEGDLQSL